MYINVNCFPGDLIVPKHDILNGTIKVHLLSHLKNIYFL